MPFVQDNSPIFKEKYDDLEYEVDELVATEKLIKLIEATDADHPSMLY